MKPNIIIKRINGGTIPVKKQPFKRNPDLIEKETDQDQL